MLDVGFGDGGGGEDSVSAGKSVQGNGTRTGISRDRRVSHSLEYGVQGRPMDLSVVFQKFLREPSCFWEIAVPHETVQE